MNELNAPRTTLSFYRYVHQANPMELMEELRAEWTALGVLGRTYVAHEGINAQISVPTANLEAFQECVRRHYPEIPFKIAVQERAESFIKLTIKVRPKLVAVVARFLPEPVPRFAIPQYGVEHCGSDEPEV